MKQNVNETNKNKIDFCQGFKSYSGNINTLTHFSMKNQTEIVSRFAWDLFGCNPIWKNRTHMILQPLHWITTSSGSGALVE